MLEPVSYTHLDVYKRQNLEGIAAGVIYLQRGVATTFGSFASIIIGICVILFTFTSILACYYQAESNMALFLKKENKAALMFVKLLGVAAILYGGLSCLLYTSRCV